MTHGWHQKNPPNERPKLTGAAILVFRASTYLQAAAAAYALAFALSSASLLRSDSRSTRSPSIAMNSIEPIRLYGMMPGRAAPLQATAHSQPLLSGIAMSARSLPSTAAVAIFLKSLSHDRARAAIIS